MTILFWLETMDKEQFLKLPGVGDMLADFEENRVNWKFSCQPELTEIVVTDNHYLAEKLREQGVCCIGFQRKEDTAFFRGVELVLNSFQGMDAGFFADAYRRQRGIPVVIGETRRLRIRESRMEDFDELYRISRETDSSAFAEPIEADYQVEKDKFLTYIRQVYGYYGFGLWTVEEKKSGKIIGRCGLEVSEDDRKDAKGAKARIELGYLIDRAYRKRGYAREACEKILEFAFQKLELPIIYAVIQRENHPSLGLARKLGFSRLGILDAEQRLEIWGLGGEVRQKKEPFLAGTSVGQRI